MGSEGFGGCLIGRMVPRGALGMCGEGIKDTNVDECSRTWRQLDRVNRGSGVSWWNLDNVTT